ncbi:hypothetical protein [Spiroplasma endosymbiont of Megaselia nigra]|uniref:hypothetical protein n=1 Tax=Spiroplasma endosymbiont of Megaselia nigra TaxID=2478537 RepID=UPI000F87B91C|nr:hypothetical protein [Spiroplasma endosymbiont of Megaselia nigra]RUO86464.1 hypothetical protein D9R21_02880 [Spiroplasma endosymbiont of Megaselia nigra]
MNNIVLKYYETTKILKKVIKEKINDIPVYIFNDKNFTISNKNNNFLFIKIESIDNFSYKENKIYSGILVINIYIIINKGNFNLLLDYSNDLVLLFEKQNKIKNIKINKIVFDAYRGTNIELGGNIFLNILLKCED